MRRLLFDDIAPDCAYHAAVVEPGLNRPQIISHSHDYHEVLYVLRGRGTHLVNDSTQSLETGMLVVLRPQDSHAFRSTLGTEFTFVNVAFPSRTWERFMEYCEIEDRWSDSQLPVITEIPLSKRRQLEGLFLETVSTFHSGPKPVDLAKLLPHCLAPLDEPEIVESQGPKFLQYAMAAMRSPENLLLGLDRFAEIAAVSQSHLCRSMRRHVNLSPTEFISTLRLQSAANLLATTYLGVSEIATQVGYDNLSYFHRCFKARYHLTPLEYRRLEGSRVT